MSISSAQDAILGHATGRPIRSYARLTPAPNYAYHVPDMSRAFSVPRESFILTDEDWYNILDKISNGRNLTAAARTVGASRQAIYDRIKRDPEFGEVIKRMKIEGIDTVEDWMLDKARSPTGFLANVAWLKAHRREKWGDDAPKQAAAPIINITIVAPSPLELRDIINSDYRVLNSNPVPTTVRIEAPESEKEGQDDADST